MPCVNVMWSLSDCCCSRCAPLGIIEPCADCLVLRVLPVHHLDPRVVGERRPEAATWASPQKDERGRGERERDATRWDVRRREKSSSRVARPRRRRRLRRRVPAPAADTVLVLHRAPGRCSARSAGTGRHRHRVPEAPAGTGSTGHRAPKAPAGTAGTGTRRRRRRQPPGARCSTVSPLVKKSRRLIYALGSSRHGDLGA